jgi:hypothetical protein
LLRMVVEEVRVARVQVTIHLAVPLDQPPDPSPHGSPRTRSPGGPDKLSSDMRLRSLDGHGRGQLPAQAPAGAGGHRSKGIDAGRQRSRTKEDGLIRGVSRVGPDPDRRAAAILRGRSCLNGALIRQEPLGSVETAGSAQRVGNGR